MPKYEVRIQLNADDDESAKKAGTVAARAVSGKVTKVLAERLTFRSLEDEA